MAKDKADRDSWHQWGQVVLYVEMVIAIVVTVFSLFLATTGAGFP